MNTTSTKKNKGQRTNDNNNNRNERKRAKKKWRKQLKWTLFEMNVVDVVCCWCRCYSDIESLDLRISAISGAELASKSFPMEYRAGTD